MFMSNGGNNRTGWKNARYDELIRAAGRENDQDKREKMLQAAEFILVHDETPVIPLFFYVGFNYYNPAKISGIFPNILDNHPLNAIGRIGEGQNPQGHAQISASP